MSLGRHDVRGIERGEVGEELNDPGNELPCLDPVQQAHAQCGDDHREPDVPLRPRGESPACCNAFEVEELGYDPTRRRLKRGTQIIPARARISQ